MTKYILGRLAQALLTVFLVMVTVFAMTRFLGDPISTLLGFGADPSVTQADIDRLRDHFGLNDPIPKQFVDFLGQMLTGDFGNSFRTGQPAMPEVLSRVPATLELALASLGLAVVIAIPAGVIAAVYRGTVLDTVVRMGALVGQAAPNFWVGLILIFLFPVYFGVLPTGGRGGIEYLVLPSITLGTASAAAIMRLTRSSMLEVLGADFITMARAKGLPARRVVFKHALRNALIPVVTILGINLGFVLSGSVIVETIFAWPGVGRLLIQSIRNNDFPIVQASVLLTSFTVVTLNFLTDLLYLFMDPRIRYAR